MTSRPSFTSAIRTSSLVRLDLRHGHCRTGAAVDEPAAGGMHPLDMDEVRLDDAAVERVWAPLPEEAPGVLRLERGRTPGEDDPRSRHRVEQPLRVGVERRRKDRLH